jgi:DNA-binding IclR family transcriptional regulator
MSSANASGRGGGDADDGKERGEMRLISRAAAVLRALADHPSGASLGELAKATGLARSTVQRVVDALAVERLISIGANANGIKLGLEISRLAAFVQSGAREQLRPYMEALMSGVQETVDLTVLDEEGAVVVIDQLASNYSLRVVSHVGQRLPLCCSASGKAHLSLLPAAQRRALIVPALSRLTPHSKTNVEALLSEIEESARRGYFLDREEYSEGVCALAMAAPLPGGGNFALAIPVPAARFATRHADYTRRLLEVRASLSGATRG